MREIKFRGMTLSGKWVYGLLAHSEGLKNQVKKGYYISNKAGSPFAYDIRPETIGQYTGLKDKNGKEIYEGDILKGDCTYLVAKNDESDFIIDSSVIFERGKYTCQGFDLDIIVNDVEVIGNIYENPESGTHRIRRIT